MKTWLKMAVIIAALLAGLGGLVWQRQSTATLRESVAAKRRAILDIPKENARLKEIVNSGNQVEAAQQIREEITRIQQEIVVLERQIQQNSAGAMRPRSSPKAPVEHYTENRDPEKGPVRLEHFRHKGQATPSAAFQTMVWAIINDETDALVPLFAISQTGRAKLREILVPMAPAIQAQFTPPEKLVGMLLAHDILEEEGFEIDIRSGPGDSGTTSLRVLRVRNGRRNKLDKNYPFQLGPTGWQLPITDQMIDGIPGIIESASMFVAPRTKVPPQSVSRP